MSADFVPVCRPRLPLAGRILPYLALLDRSRVYSNHGALVEEFERRLDELFGLDLGGVVATASGTAGLVAAILATAGRATAEKPYCLCPNYTFAATALAAEQCGYRPYLVDIDPSSWGLDSGKLAAHPLQDSVGVTLVTAPFDRAIALEDWECFFRRTGVPVVVDAAASIETFADNKITLPPRIPVVLSLHATKAFGVGEGGAVLCADRALGLAVHSTLNFGFSGTREVSGPAINGKMSEYHAAVGLAELDGWAAKRAQLRAVANAYRAAGARFGQRIHVAPAISACYALVEATSVGNGERIRDALKRNALDHRLWYGQGLHREPHFANCPRDTLQESGALAPCLIGLPVAPDLPLETIDRIVGTLAAPSLQAATDAATFSDISGAATAPNPFLRGSRTT